MAIYRRMTFLGAVYMSRTTKEDLNQIKDAFVSKLNQFFF